MHFARTQAHTNALLTQLILQQKQMLALLVEQEPADDDEQPSVDLAGDPITLS